jgi:Na+-transporting NADH:ubiquinone oxidoreductase subunit C
MAETETGKLKERGWYPVVYMFGITFVCAGILVGLATGTHARVEANARIRFERALLEAVAVVIPQRASPAAVHRLFLEHLGEPAPASGDAYRLLRNGRTVAYALPFEGQGFWDVIRGVIGIAHDGATVLGLAVYDQKETPGLGAEIAQAPFENAFAGLRLAPGRPALRVRQGGGTDDANAVDAVTGATQTCTRLERMLNEAIAAWRGRMEGR